MYAYGNGTGLIRILITDYASMNHDWNEIPSLTQSICPAYYLLV
jgi:hypothetical protein